MENYIVRIYRRDATDPDKLTGIFESVERETRNSFTSLNNLIDLLAPERVIGGGSAGDGDVQEQQPANFAK